MTKTLTANGKVEWQGEHRAADESAVFETRPAVLANAAGVHWAVLRIYRFGIYFGEEVRGPFDHLSAARESALALQRDFVAPDADTEEAS
jgi:hypothetical protein